MNIEDLPQNQWGAVSGIDGTAGVKARGVWNQNGKDLNAWLRIDWPNGHSVLLHATTDMTTIEREMGTLPDAANVQSGWFGSSFLRKTGITKIAKAVTSIAKKAINNPLIKTALMATPVGQAAFAIQRGAKLVQSALKGDFNAKNFLNFALQQATAGNPTAQQALKLIRAGARQVPQIARFVPQVARYAMPFASFIPGASAVMPAISTIQRFARSSGDCDDARWVGLCAGDAGPVPESSLRLDQDMDAILTFASAGSFEGARYILDRMALQPMEDNPNRFGTRAALLLGRETGAARFA